MSENLTQRERKARIRRGLPIEACGLTFYPIKMTDYEEFLECKNALCIRQTSLAKANFEYLSMPFLSALWAMEIDTMRQTGKTVGVLERVIRLLYLSLRLGYDRQKAFGAIYCERNDSRKLAYIEVMTQDGETAIKITPTDFSTIIRPLIAEQNGIKLPDESENPDIVQAEQQMAQEGERKIKYDLETLISSVANACNIRECEMDDWTVWEFEKRRQAIDRKINYQIYAQAEMSGMVKFNKGNPCPSWCFDGAETLTSALITLDEMQEKYKGAGDVKQTIANGGSYTD